MFNNNEVVDGDSGGLNKKLSKFEKSLVLEHDFTLLRLAFINIWIEIRAAYILGKKP